jgi:hypothetical protein
MTLVILAEDAVHGQPARPWICRLVSCDWPHMVLEIRLAQRPARLHDKLGLPWLQAQQPKGHPVRGSVPDKAA